MMGYSQWLIASAVIILLARRETLTRWSIFAGIYLLRQNRLAFFSRVFGGFGFRNDWLLPVLGLIFSS